MDALFGLIKEYINYPWWATLFLYTVENIPEIYVLS